MKRISILVILSVFILLIMAAPSICLSQTTDQGSIFLPGQTTTTPQDDQVSIELEKIEAEIQYLEYKLLIYSIYGITGDAKDQAEYDLLLANQQLASIIRAGGTSISTAADCASFITTQTSLGSRFIPSK